MKTISKHSPIKVDGQQWEDPANPEAPKDERDKEQIERQFEEAKRRNENLAAEKNRQKIK